MNLEELSLDDRIPYTIRPSLPLHGLRQYRYHCKSCKRSADYCLPPPSIDRGKLRTHLPRVGTNPSRCHGCKGRLSIVSQGTLYSAMWRERNCK